MQAKDITAGESWACQFRVTTFLDEDGAPVEPAHNLQLGQAHPGNPGEYTSLGVVKTRDTAQQLIELVDTKTQRVFVVAYDDTWDYDTVEWV